jgi:hypothetical protein
MNRPTSFKLHILPLFRSDPDVAHMNDQVGIDLTDYNTVKAISTKILTRLRGIGPLMPPAANGGPWPDEWIALFERWIQENHPV